MILAAPHLVDRAPQPYVALRKEVDFDSIARDLPPLATAVSRWLADRGVSPSGPPFWNYTRIRATEESGCFTCEMVVDVGFPVDSPMAVTDPTDGMRSGTLPAGTYASLRHRGHPSELYGRDGPAARVGRRAGADVGQAGRRRGADMARPARGLPQ